MERRSGFTLLEMSIVITIIALIIGGLLLGKETIKNAKLQGVVSDVNRYKNAVRLFKDKYHYLPGDKPDATAFWGQDPTAADCTAPPTGSNATPTTKTCNGNGDGFIGDSTNTPLTMGTVNNGEALHAWQQLADAGFIEGTYNGTISSNTGGLDPGTNIPISKLNDNGYTLFYAAPTATNGNTGAVAGVFGANYRHIIVYGSAFNSTNVATLPSANLSSYGWLLINVPTYLPGLNALDAQNIDTKVDDGLPGTGNVLSYTTDSPNTPTCASTDVETTAVYTATSTAKGLTCSLIFITGF